MVTLSAVVTKYEVSHWLVCSFNLDLNKASSIRLAMLAFEHAFVLFVVPNNLLVPVCSLVPQTTQHCCIAFLLHFLTGESSWISSHELFRSKFQQEEGLDWFRVVLISQIENKTPRFIVVILATTVMLEQGIFESQS